MHRFPEIERLRGLAILLVLTVHIPLNRLVPGFVDGQTGVDLFFVLSGFVVALSLFRKLPPFEPGQSLRTRLRNSRAALGGFYLRRAFRILPLALFASCLVLALSTALHSEDFMSPPSVIFGELASFFTLTYNYALAWGAPDDIAHFWSLNVEEHFYLLLPLFLILVPRTRLRIGALILGIVLVVSLLRNWVPAGLSPLQEWKFLNFSSHTRFDGLLVGVLIAILHERGLFKGEKLKSGERAVGIAVGVLAFAVIACVRHRFEGPEVVRVAHLIATCASGVLVIIAAYNQNHIFPFRGVSQALEFLGARAYPLYLLHHPLGRAFATSGVGGVIFFVTLVLVIFGAAELCHRLIEQPFIQFGRRFQRENFDF